MTIWEYFDARARRLGLLDTKLAQLASIFVALIIVKLIPQIMELNLWWFIILAIIFAIKPLITFLGNKNKPLSN